MIGAGWRGSGPDRHRHRGAHRDGRLPGRRGAVAARRLTARQPLSERLHEREHRGADERGLRDRRGPEHLRLRFSLAMRRHRRDRAVGLTPSDRRAGRLTTVWRMAEQPAPGRGSRARPTTRPSIDWLHGQPYAEWARARALGVPRRRRQRTMFHGPGTSYQMLALQGRRDRAPRRRRRSRRRSTASTSASSWATSSSR